MTTKTPAKRGPGRPRGTGKDDTGGDPNMVAGNLHAGVTISWLAEHFKMAKPTVKKRLAALPPKAKIHNSALYDLKDAAGYLVEPKVDVSQWIQSLRPNDLPPLLQDTYWSAMIKRQKWEENAGHLWRTEAVLEVLGEAFKRINSAVKLWEDDVDRVDELSESQRQTLRGMTDGLLADLHETLVAMPKEKATRNQMAELEEMEKAQNGQQDSPEDDSTDELI